jgi:hypothetical protein
MRNFIKLLLFTIFGVTVAAQAQSPLPAASIKHYKTDFVVKEVDANGHVVNSRSFTTILATNSSRSTQPNQIRSGDRVPIRASLNEKGDTNIQYIDIGVNIDCNQVQEMGGELGMVIRAEISSVPAGTDLNAMGDPMIRSFQWSSDVVLVPGVPTTVFSSDDVGSKAKTQVEVTATLIK